MSAVLTQLTRKDSTLPPFTAMFEANRFRSCLFARTTKSWPVYS